MNKNTPSSRAMTKQMRPHEEGYYGEVDDTIGLYVVWMES